MQAPTRSAWTCVSCRRRKVRCDSQDPCTHCIRRGEDCIWPENAQQKKHGLSQISLANDLQTRVERIEAVLGLRQNHQTQPVEHLSTRELGRGLNPTASAPNSQNEILSNSTPVQDVELEALADAAHGVEIHRHDDFDHHIIDNSPSQLQRSPHRHHNARRTDENTILEARQLLSQTLPTKTRCDDLLRSYLYNVEWIHHPLHVPTFQADYDLFWSPKRMEPPDLQWLALLMVVLCLGSHFNPLGHSIKQEEELCAASQRLLVLSNHLANHSITVIQTLISMGLWLNNRGLSNTHHAQLALAIKMAMNLGLGKIDAAGWDRKVDDDTFFRISETPASTKANVELEIKRRLWWSLVCQDYYTASSCNFTYTIFPKQCKTNMFLNVDDSSIWFQLRDTTAPSLYEVATASSYQLLKIPFARTAKAHTDLYNEDALTYEAVLDLEKLLWKTYDDLPDFFKWRLDQKAVPFPASGSVVYIHLEWQRIFLGFTVHNRVLRLHRPFMAHGYHDSTMVHSRQATIESALACLALAEEGRRINFPGLRWWVVLIHIFTSGVALCIDYHYLLRFQRQKSTTFDFSQLIRHRRQHISRALRLLKPASDSSVAAARAIAVIESLVRQAEHHSTETQGSGHGITKRRRLDSSQALSPALSLPEVTPSNTYPASESTNGVDYSTFQPPDNDWLGTMNIDEWTGPDWDDLFASFSNDSYSPNEGTSADLYETINSFANGFAPD